MVLSDNQKILMTNPVISNSYTSSNNDYIVETESLSGAAIRQVMSSVDKWQISDVDESVDPKYYGFLDASGAWYILQNTSGTSFRYVMGIADYTTSWTNRASLTYDYYNLIF